MTVSYPASGVVSVWVGNFPSEEDFDQCVDGPITEMLGLKTELEGICEVSFQPDPISIRELLTGFSGYKSFIEKATCIADSREIRVGNAALVCYYVNCEHAPIKWDQLDFLGTFSGCDSA